MHIKHNLRLKDGLDLDDLVSGQVYLRVDIPALPPLVYLAVAASTQPRKATNLVNIKTGCLIGRVSSSARFRHLPDATLDTGE